MNQIQNTQFEVMGVLGIKELSEPISIDALQLALEYEGDILWMQRSQEPYGNLGLRLPEGVDISTLETLTSRQISKSKKSLKQASTEASRLQEIYYNGDVEKLKEGLKSLSSLPIIGIETLVKKILGNLESGKNIKVGVIGCMPKLSVFKDDDGNPVYDIGNPGLKGSVDFKAEDLAMFRINLQKLIGNKVELECLVADTEPIVKSEGRILNPEGSIEQITDKVVQRIAKTFPGKVLPRSEVFPLCDEIYSNYFEGTFTSILTEILASKPFTSVRVMSRLESLLQAGVEYNIAVERSIRELALQDTEYAMEGKWMVEKSDWDAYIVIDNYPISSAQRTLRLVDQENLPIIFPVDYEII